MAGTRVADESIVGDECHIVSAAPGGPRYDPAFPRESLDDYSNLLLLCKVHHKLVDDQVKEFPPLLLARLKARHEKWVSDNLDASRSKGSAQKAGHGREHAPAFLSRIHSGRELLAIVTNASAYGIHYDDVRTEAEEDLVASFFQDTQDWGELELESARDTMWAARSLDEHLRDLDEAGFWVFGGRELQILQGKSGQDFDWPVAHVRVLRSSNQGIIRLASSVKQGDADPER